MTIYSLVKDNILLCSNCAGSLRQMEDDGLVCAICETSFPVHQGVAMMLPFSDEMQQRGVVSRTFSRPMIYDSIVKMKWYLTSALGLRDKMIGISSYCDGKEVLDIGCGPNLELPSNELDFRKVSRYVGVDFSRDFVLEASRNHSSLQHDFIQASASHLPFASNSFDVVVASFTIHHVPELPSTVLSEMFRIAREHIVVIDHIKSDSKLLGLVQGTYWRLVDGGFHYQTESQWKDSTGNRRPVAELRTGAIGKHVIKRVYRS